jgi:hypothetical protein
MLRGLYPACIRHTFMSFTHVMTSLMRVKSPRKELGGLPQMSVSLCHNSEGKFVRSFFFRRFRIFLERVQQNNTYLGALGGQKQPSSGSS